MSSLSRELVFLILQFLEEEKFKESVHKLEKESAFFFNMKYFEEKVHAGDWEEVEKYSSGFTKVDDNRYSMNKFFEISSFNATIWDPSSIPSFISSRRSLCPCTAQTNTEVEGKAPDGKVWASMKKAKGTSGNDGASQRFDSLSVLPTSFGSQDASKILSLCPSVQSALKIEIVLGKTKNLDNLITTATKASTADRKK